MEDLPLVVKVVEVVFMEVLVGIAVIVLLIAVVRDIVEAKVLESRRHDQIALEPEAQMLAAAQPIASPPIEPQPEAVQPAL